MSKPILSVLPCLFFLLTTAAEISCAKDNSDSIVRRSHQTLFGKFLEGKKCQFSKDKSKLIEVSIFGEKTEVSVDVDLELPEHTEEVIGLFEHLVIRGDRLGKVSAFLHFETMKTQLKLVSSDKEFLVFDVAKVPWAKIQKRSLAQEEHDLDTQPEIRDNGSESLVLRIECLDDIEIHEIALRTNKDLFADFAEFKKSMMSFPRGRIGDLMKSFYLMTMNKDFDDLSKSLSQPSDEFNRLVYPRTMASTANKSHPLRGMINDSRVAKLYEALSQMEPADAAEISSTIFDRSLAEFGTSWQNAKFLPTSARYGVEAHLFLCSEFCSAETVLEKMDLWDSWHEERSKTDFQFKYTAGLDTVYAMNLEMNLIMRDRNFSILEMNGWLAENLGPSLAGPPSSNPAHGRGGARPPTLMMMDMNSSDSTPSHSEIVARISVLKFGSVLHNPIRKDALQKILRGELVNKRFE